MSRVEAASDTNGAGVDTCAICLSHIGEGEGDGEAFLDNCYHRFHLQVGLIVPTTCTPLSYRDMASNACAAVCNVLDQCTKSSPFRFGHGLQLSSVQDTLFFGVTQLSGRCLQVKHTKLQSFKLYKMWR